MEKIDLKRDLADTAQALARVSAAVIPALLLPEHSVVMACAGATLSEFVGIQLARINDSRREYAETYCRQVSAKVPDLGSKLVGEKAILFDAGFLDAARAEQQDRLAGIANIVAMGINGYESIVEPRQFLSDLARLDDLDLLYLTYLQRGHYDRESGYLAKTISLARAREIALSHSIEIRSDREERDIPVSTNVIATNSMKRLVEMSMIKNTREERGKPVTYELDHYGEILLRFLEFKGDPINEHAWRGMTQGP